jgi:Spy/CpxP family protein refolding chaperone
MHSSLKAWQRARRAFGRCGEYGGWWGHGPGHHPGRGPAEEGFEEGFGGGGGFGVRRPLRFLAHKLDLDERQIAELARILDELKTERAQAEVDRRRTVAAFADALTGETFDSTKAGEGGALRVQSAERLRDAVLKALQQIHAILTADQRVRLAYLIRTGTLTV